jgi:EAL domain-containing protein (putative c-di-GMP-specific phosphodiesterase class I)
LSLLQKQGCDEVQGYLVGRPVPADRFEEHLTRKRGTVMANVRRQQRSSNR